MPRSPAKEPALRRVRKRPPFSRKPLPTTTRLPLGNRSSGLAQRRRLTWRDAPVPTGPPPRRVPRGTPPLSPQPPVTAEATRTPARPTARMRKRGGTATDPARNESFLCSQRVLGHRPSEELVPPTAKKRTSARTSDGVPRSGRAPETRGS
ncbi:uncharacterized protein DKFZp434B061-like [Meriones unguiculatus]|uniref:uncharacterized protein DKFZp434B061-like n=1 Tax=Meriones unguiculatus TaxID=10047 RepID=UPI00293ECF79|nr:uncharacterized protein DKFZp434B061-like [Meriones unguiculatus]